MGTLILKDILLIFVLSIPLVLLFRQLKFPAILGFIATGALIGPHGLAWIAEEKQIDFLAEMGVTLLLFSVGLEFSFSAFKRVGRTGVMAGLLQIMLTIVVGFLFGQVFLDSPYQSLYWGCIMALSSTAVVLTTFTQNRIHDTLAGRISTVILILQDLALIPMLVLLPWLADATATQNWGRAMVWQGGKAFLLIASVIAFAKYLAEPLLRIISRARSRELFTIAVLSLALGMAWVTHSLGLSFALGAFLGGMMVGVTSYQYQALSEAKAFQYCFNSLFFVSIGMLLDFHFVAEHAVEVILLVLLVPTLKVLLTTLSLRLSGLGLSLAVWVGIVLGQVGEFSFLLAYMGEKSGALDQELYQWIITLTVITMMLTPLWIPKASQMVEWLSRFPLIKSWFSSDLQQALRRAALPLKDHVVICGFGPLGSTFGKILKEHRKDYLVLELNPETIKKIRQAKGEAFFGDGASEEILYHSGLERARLLAITVPDFLNAAAIIRQARKVNPEIQIITRAKYRDQVQALYAAGADIVISEELEGGLEMGRFALKVLGIPEAEVEGYVKKVREFGSADFF